MSVYRSRLPLIDALKALASQFIVLHHLAFYGPMSDFTHLLVPQVVSWFSQRGRLAVQVFLVVGGFLATRTLAPNGLLKPRQPLELLRRRYVNIVLPYGVALVVAMLATAWAARWMSHPSLPDSPAWAQLVAHMALLQGILDVPSLSAGVWYVAIDFQLFALFLGLLWLARSMNRLPAERPRTWPALVMVGVLGTVALLYFNLDPSWDNWAFYFFGSYTLGVLAYWANHWQHGRHQRWIAALAVGTTLLALAVDFRVRIALALCVALVLGVSEARGWIYRWPRSRVLGYLGRISYGVFLMNFPVSLVVNAAFTRFAVASVWVQTLGVALAWLASVLAGAAFHHGVEVPLRRWGQPSAGHPFWLRLATLFTRRI
jgi:peptidoglycan/LPS O-acetylase OafA/YrhL